MAQRRTPQKMNWLIVPRKWLGAADTHAFFNGVRRKKNQSNNREATSVDSFSCLCDGRGFCVSHHACSTRRIMAWCSRMAWGSHNAKWSPTLKWASCIQRKWKFTPASHSKYNADGNRRPNALGNQRFTSLSPQPTSAHGRDHLHPPCIFTIYFPKILPSNYLSLWCQNRKVQHH